MDRLPHAARARDPRRRLPPRAGHARGRPRPDAADLDWILANADDLLREIGLADYPGGGIQITAIAEGSIASQAGLRPNDVIRAVNGREIRSAVALAELRADEALRRSAQLTVTLERAGATRTLVIQPVRN